MMYSPADGMAYVSALKAEFSGFKSQAGDMRGLDNWRAHLTVDRARKIHWGFESLPTHN